MNKKMYQQPQSVAMPIELNSILCASPGGLGFGGEDSGFGGG